MHDVPTEVEELGRKEEELAHPTDSSLVGQLEAMPHVESSEAARVKCI